MRKIAMLFVLVAFMFSFVPAADAGRDEPMLTAKIVMDDETAYLQVTQRGFDEQDNPYTQMKKIFLESFPKDKCSKLPVFTHQELFTGSSFEKGHFVAIRATHYICGDNEVAFEPISIFYEGNTATVSLIFMSEYDYPVITYNGMDVFPLNMKEAVFIDYYYDWTGTCWARVMFWKRHPGVYNGIPANHVYQVKLPNGDFYSVDKGADVHAFKRLRSSILTIRFTKKNGQVHIAKLVAK